MIIAFFLIYLIFFFPSPFLLDFHLVGVIWIGRWAGDRKERISEVTLKPPLCVHAKSNLSSLHQAATQQCVAATLQSPLFAGC